jgi:hypothetical protein
MEATGAARFPLMLSFTLHRPSAIRGFRGPADRTSRRNRGRLGFCRAWKSLLAIASVKLLLKPAKLLCGDMMQAVEVYKD